MEWPKRKDQAAQKNRAAPFQERALKSRMVRPKLYGGSTAEEVEQNRNYGQDQQNVDESAGDVKRGETQQPQYQENSGDNR
jgi:hypothetical protein